MSEYYTDYKIIQIVAAPPGWRAKYKQDDGSFCYEEIVCFALAYEAQKVVGDGRLVKLEDFPTVHGVTANEYLQIADEIANFVELVGPNCSQED